jgi:hypothetical protein
MVTANLKSLLGRIVGELADPTAEGVLEQMKHLGAKEA